MTSIIASNCSGSFALFGISSRYQGVFFSHAGRVLRTIADIVLPWPVEPKMNWPVDNFVNGFWKSSHLHGGVADYFWFAHRLPVFFYELTSECVDVVLDCREIYDNTVWGRYYDVSIEGKAVVVHYKKKVENNESAEFGEYDFWLAFYGAKFFPIKKWEEKKHFFDVDRNSPPVARYVFRAFHAGRSFVCAVGSSKWEALKLAKDSWKNKSSLAREAEQFSGKIIKGAQFNDVALNDAAKYARYSLASLCCGQGLYAGLPWFTQRWARDELISVKALLLSKQFALAKSILFYWLNKLTSAGKLQGTLTESIADSGWLFVRFNDFWHKLNSREKQAVNEKLVFYEKEIERSLENGLVTCTPKQTWMDSLDRDGARIEIQALTLAALKLGRKNNVPSVLEKKLKQEVKKQFWTGSYLKDGSDDLTIRPNIFIAAYVYPELLSKAEWIKCFDAVLPKLWLDWGGISTVDISNQNFMKNHTGENSASYHNGDSWFWLNNLAAIVLNNFGKKKYKKYVDAIVNASVEEILNQGAVGHHAELSSAEKMTSSGCLAQAWSVAIALELFEVIKKNI